MAAPDWSQAPHLLLAEDVALELRYIDLWRALRGQRLRIHSLKARQLDAHLERLADGRASWTLVPLDAGKPPTSSPPPPAIGQLRVSRGTVHVRDVPTKVDLVVRLSLVDVKRAAVLRADASGHYRDFPVQIELVASGRAPWDDAAGANSTSTLTLKANVGRTSLAFDGDAGGGDASEGSVGDAALWRRLSGRFSLSGPSLAAVGDAVGVTLPTTSAFHSRGAVVKDGHIWRVVVDDATLGASQLQGVFSYDRSGAVPLLSGRLGGKRLALADLGPVVGVEPKAAAGKAKPAARERRKVLPDRHFDLVSLRTMDANVLIDIETVDLNTHLLEPVRPLRAHLVLAAGVLRLNSIDAQTADGHLVGDLVLDGRTAAALWSADVKWRAVRLERWIRQARNQARARAAPPWISGRLDGAARLQGHGRSTADILASLGGSVHTELRSGAVSHLAVEAAGLDIAQGLGVMLRGDDALAVPCAVADLVASAGVLRPRLMVLDTRDSVIWIDGSLSLASETLDLRAIVAPKDFSALTLRTPLRVRGSLAHPIVSLQKDALGRKLGASFVLALLNPLAALIPLIDPGDRAAARAGAADCQSLRQRSMVKTAAVRSAAAAAAVTPGAISPRLRSPTH